MNSLKDVMESKNLVVFGASQNPTKPGSMLLDVLRQTGYKGNYAGINPQGGKVYGVKIFKSLDDIPFDVDLAVMIIPPAAVVKAVYECAQKRVKGVVISSEGFSESGEAGRQHQEEIIRIAKNTGIRVIGPNTLGLLNTETGLTTSYFADSKALLKGNIGFAAQSGIFVGAFMRYLSSLENLGISKGLGLGNKIDINECDAMDYLSDDEQTKIIGLYLEDVRDGKRFLSSAKNAAVKKPLLMIKGGRTIEGSKATATHTASLAGNDKILDGAASQAGILRIESIDEMLASLMGFTWMPLPAGNKIAIVTYSGAQSIMCIDLATDLGLSTASFDPKTKILLSEVISNEYKSKNPIDIFPDMMVHGFEKTMLGILDALLQDNGVHGIIFISFAIYGSDMYKQIVEMIHERNTKPVFFSLMGSKAEVDSTGNFLLKNKIPFYLFPEAGIRTMFNMWQYAKHKLKVGG